MKKIKCINSKTDSNKMRRKTLIFYLVRLCFLMIFVVSTTISYAQIKLPAFFGNNMVLQQNTQASVWGADKPNTTIILTGNWNESATTKTDENGKWKVKIKTPKAGGPFTLSIKGSNKVVLENVMIGEVWLCSGQSNMEMPVKGNPNQPINGSNEAILNSTNSNIRLFSVKKNPSLIPLDDVSGEWLSANPQTVRNYSATAYFFGRKINSLLNIPIGLIHTSWGASNVETWMDEETLSEFKRIEIASEIPKEKPQQSPTLLYNGMLRPLQGYTIKGVLWYQGEANRNNPKEYTQLLPAMINQWRNQWQKGNFPFYFVQIAPFNYRGGTNSAYVREAQLKTMRAVENTGMVVTLDIGDSICIHPSEKRIVGERLAYWALAKNYDIKGISWSGPIYRDMKTTEDGKIILYFDYAPLGFTSFGKPLTGFEIAAEDKVFYPATVKINNNKTLTVFSDKVKNPVSVRYCFDNYSPGSLFNVEGLPASPFRTDNW